MIRLQKELAEKVGTVKAEVTLHEVDAELIERRAEDRAGRDSGRHTAAGQGRPGIRHRRP